MLKENSLQWTYEGTGLPFSINFHSLKLINFIGKVLLIGGSETIEEYDSLISATTIYELEKSPNGYFEWILSDFSLKYPRTTTFTVLDVPFKSIKLN